MQHYFSWLIKAPSIEHYEIREKCSSILCECLNLCLSVGCGCTVEGKENVCQEESILGLKKDFGPRWTVTATTISEDTLKIDVYIGPPVYIHELTAAHDAIIANINRQVIPMSRGFNL